jgi:2-dehydropantoate 2-reductase
MQIIILGAGAIGTFYAARLSYANDVTLVAHRPEQAQAIGAAGVRVTGLEEATCRINATTNIAAIEPGTLVLLTTKVYASAEAVRPLVPLLRPDTIIVCLQNGLHSERLVRDVVGGRCAVLRGITNFGAIFVEPGVVSLRTPGDTIIEDGPVSAALAEMFTRCELAGRVSSDITREVWKKLIVNCVINPLTAMTGMEVGWVANERLDPLKQRIIDECMAVARHEGVVFETNFTRMLNETYAPSRNLSSMHQDLRNGKRTEIDYMNGAVVELGRRYAVPCPINASLVAIIKALEAGPVRDAPVTDERRTDMPTRR